VANVLGVRLGRDRRNFFCKLHRKPGVAIDMYLHGLGVEIAGRQVPVLALAAVGRQLDRSAVGPVKGLVDVQHCLHEVIAWGNVPQRPNGIAGCLRSDRHRLAGGQSIDRGPEDDLRAGAVVDLHARFGGRISREQQQHSAIERFD
jgi:hypothetical protein